MIRDARTDDLPRILAITNEAIVNTTSVFSLSTTTLQARRLWMRERQASRFPVLVAEVDGIVQGFGSFGTFRAWEGFRHTVEHSLYVDPSAQGRGLGTAILDALIKQARALGLHVMVGGIEAKNTRSLALHGRAGFTESARLEQVGRKFDRWLDLVFVQKIL